VMNSLERSHILSRTTLCTATIGVGMHRLTCSEHCIGNFNELIVNSAQATSTRVEGPLCVRPWHSAISLERIRRAKELFARWTAATSEHTAVLTITSSEGFSLFF
jgi:hypothetical protein